MLRSGSHGDDVLALQERLEAAGFDPGPIDGAFGAKTEAAVRKLQEASGIAVDGVVGPQTEARLAAAQADAAAASSGSGATPSDERAAGDGPAPL